VGLPRSSTDAGALSLAAVPCASVHAQSEAQDGLMNGGAFLPSATA
jgi:hypothetical protein